MTSRFLAQYTLIEGPTGLRDNLQNLQRNTFFLSKISFKIIGI